MRELCFSNYAGDTIAKLRDSQAKKSLHMSALLMLQATDTIAKLCHAQANKFSHICAFLTLQEHNCQAVGSQANKFSHRSASFMLPAALAA